MTHAIMFDTFQCAKDLKNAGFTEIQVETQVKIIKKQTDAINDFIEDGLATKKDIEISKNELTLKIEAIKGELLFKLGSMIVGTAVGGLGALVVAACFHKHLGLQSRVIFG